MSVSNDLLVTTLRLEGAENQVRGQREVGKSAALTGQQISQMRQESQQYGRAATRMGAATLAVGGIVALTIQKHIEQEEAVRKLSLIYGEGYEELVKYAAGIQKVTRFGDEQMMAAAAVGATYLGLRDNMKEAMVASANLSEVTGQDLTQSMHMLGKASGGMIDNLRRVGIMVERSEFDAKGMVAVYEQLQAEQKNVAFTLDSLSKELDQFRNVAGDAAETIGNELVPEVTALVGGAKDLAEWVTKASPPTKRLIADAMKFTVVAGIVGTVVLKIKSMTLAWRANAAMVKLGTAETVAAVNAETAAVRQNVVAWNESGVAKARTGATGSALAGGGTKAGPGWLGRGMPGGAVGAGLQVAAFSLAVNSAGKAVSTFADETSTTGDKVHDVGLTAGYVAGAFNPLILAATGLGHVISGVVNYVYEQKLAAMAAASGQGLGGADITPEAFARLKEQGIISADIMLEQYRAAQAGVRRQVGRYEAGRVTRQEQAWEQREQAPSSQAERIRLQMAGFGAGGGQLKGAAWLRAEPGIRGKMENVRSALDREAKALNDEAEALRETAGASKDDTEQRKLHQKAIDLETQALAKGLQAKQELARHEDKLATVMGRVNKEREKSVGLQEKATQLAEKEAVQAQAAAGVGAGLLGAAQGRSPFPFTLSYRSAFQASPPGSHLVNAPPIVVHPRVIVQLPGEAMKAVSVYVREEFRRAQYHEAFTQ